MFNIFLDIAVKMHENWGFVPIVAAVVSFRKVGPEAKAKPFKSKADWLQLFNSAWSM